MRVEGGVSGPAEDLRLVSEVEAGVNFRLDGQGRGQPRPGSCRSGGGARVLGFFGESQNNLLLRCLGATGI